MAVVFNAIAAHPQANSYISLAEANQYFENRDNSSAWTAAGDDQKQQVLIEATRRIDSESFRSEKLYQWQGLEFPRFGGINARSFSTSADSATSNTLVSSNITDVISMPDDYWNYGSVFFYSKGQDNYMGIYEIADFVASTGTVTTTNNFNTVPSAGDNFKLIREVPREIKWATCETALAVIEDAINEPADPNVKRQQLGDESVEYFDKGSVGVTIPAIANQMIAPYIRRAGRLEVTKMFR